MKFRNSARSPALVLLGAGIAPYRSYALAAMAEAAPVVLIDPDPPTWARDHTTAEIRADITDPSQLAAAVELAASRYSIGGVTTYAEEAVYEAAHLAEALGLPGPTPEAVALCRDKHATRRALQKAGVGSARSELVRDQHQATDAAERIGYPVVVKPRRLAGSVAVRLCVDGQEVRHAYQAAASARLLTMDGGGVLVEEYLDGPEISAECVITADGVCHLVAITRKVLGPHPGFEEVGHLVDARDPLLADEDLAQTVFAAAAASRYRAGVIHIELRLLTRRHGVIEINARPAGDLIPHLVHQATGVDLARASADIALAREPHLIRSRVRAAGIRFLYPARAGVLEHRVSGHPGAHWLERSVWTREVGDHVTPPPGNLFDRLAHVVVTGPDAATCAARLDAVEATTEVRIRPHTSPHACVR